MLKTERRLSRRKDGMRLMISPKASRNRFKEIIGNTRLTSLRKIWISGTNGWVLNR